MYEPRLRRVLALIFLATCVFGCAPEADFDEEGGEEAVQVERSSEALYRVEKQWPNGNVPVCWATQSQAAKYATRRMQVQRVLNESWPAVARVSFTGWGNCPSTTRGMVVIKLEDNSVGEATIGYQGPLGTHTVRLGAESSDFTGGLIPHEFGHVLGFSHEMARPDFMDEPSGLCRERNRLGDNFGTLADRTSIMAYAYCHYAPYLSPADVEGAQRAYGVSTLWSWLTGPETFDANFYLSTYGDLRAAYGNDTTAARNHWATFGFHEGRRSSQQFDVAYYLSRYGDLRDAFGADNYLAAIYHWNQFGLREGRRSASTFDVAYYLSAYGDLGAAFGTDYRAGLNHWLTYGRYEGRRTYPEQP